MCPNVIGNPVCVSHMCDVCSMCVVFVCVVCVYYGQGDNY